MAVMNGTPTDGVMNSVSLQQFTSPYVSTKHTEANTLVNAYGGDMNKIFMGILKPWNSMNYFSTPLLSMTALKGNILEVPGFEATIEYWLTYKKSQPKFIEYISETGDKLGINKSIFFIVLDRDFLVEGDTFKFNKRSDFEFRVVNQYEFKGQIIEPYGSNYFKYAVKLSTNDEEEYCTPDVFVTGQQIIFGSNISGEFGDNATTVKNIGAGLGFTAMRCRTGNSEVSITHSITADADRMRVETSKPLPQGTNYYDISQKEMISQMLHGQYVTDPNTGRQTFVKDTKKASGWFPTVLGHMSKELALMLEYNTTWGVPDYHMDKTGKKLRKSAGLYWTIKKHGSYQEYNDVTEIPNIIRSIPAIMFSGRRDILPQDRMTRIRCGTAASIEIFKYFGDYAQKGLNQFQIINDGQNPFLKGMISGKDSMNLSYKPIQFKSAHFPELGLIEVLVDPVLDYVDEDDDFREKVNHYNLSSYMIFFEDITDSKYSNRDSAGSPVPDGTAETFYKGSNVMLVRPKGYQDYTSIEVGRGDCPSLTTFFGLPANNRVVSTQRKGFTVTMTTCGEVLVKDPTKVFMWEFNPTGRSL